MATEEGEYLRVRMDLGVFKKNADLGDKFNKETLKMALGYMAANGRRYDSGLLGAAEAMADRDKNKANQKKEREKAAGGK